MRHSRGFFLLVVTILTLFPATGIASSLQVSWDANDDADLAGYKVYYRTESGTYGSPIDVGNATDCLIDNVSAGDTYFVAVSAYDSSNNESARSDEESIYIPVSDMTPPTGRVLINSGAEMTASRTVTLTLTANDTGGPVSGMKISNNGVTYSSEIAYASIHQWQLSSDDGSKTVYVLFKDSAGNWMTSPATASITLRLDSDNDGMPDAWETANGLNPNDPADALADADNDGLSNYDEFLNSKNPNLANDVCPYVYAGGDQVVAPQRVILDGSGSVNPVGGSLSYTWTQLNGPVSVLLETPTESVASFMGIVAGTYRFKLTCSNGTCNGSSMVTVTVQNVAPSVDAGSNMTIDAGSAVKLHATGSDPNEDSLYYRWTKVSGPSVTLGNLAQQDITFTPVNAGLYTFSVVCSDGINTSTAAQVSVTVNAVNHAPTADAGTDQDVTKGSQVDLNGTASTDPDDDTLSYSWAQVSGPVTVSLSGSQTSRPYFTASAVGTYEFCLVVNDGKVSSTSDSVVIRVVSSNNPPVADAGEDMHVYVGDDVVLNASGSHDPDADQITYSWTQESGASVEIFNANTATPFFTPTTSGVFVLKVTVSDGQISATDTVTITVDNQNQVPVAVISGSSSNITATVGNTVTLDGSASYDPDGTAISHIWSQTSGPAVSLSSPNKAKASFKPTQAGTYVFSLKVYDGTDTSSAATVTVIVQSTSATISLLTPVNGSVLSSRPTYKWSAQGFSSYSVYISINNSSSWVKIYSGKNTSCSMNFIWSFIPSKTTVKWYVQGKTSSGQVKNSSAGYFTKK
jgi:hypothetical protein